MITLAVLLDWVIGDPQGWPHPIIFIGKMIGWLDARLKDRTRFEGLGLWLIVVGISGLVAFTIESLLLSLPWYMSILMHAFLLSTMLATKCLADEAKKVLMYLQSGNLQQARIQVGYLVGRDTSELSEEAVTKACIETVAENTIDGSIAPLFYMVLGNLLFGLPLTFAVMYKAINTLDSMVGYKNERHGDVGFVSAKIDDLANLIPARIGSLFMMIAGAIYRLDGKRALMVWWRDRYNHKSPNAGFPESVISGLLNIQLGGANYYFGKLVEKPTIGDPIKPVTYDMIEKTNHVLYMTVGIAIAIQPLFFGGLL